PLFRSGDAELGQRTADLGELCPVDLVLALAGHEVMGAAIGVERAEQAVPANRLGQTKKARHRAFFVDQQRRIDLAGGVVERDDEIEIAPERRNPAMLRAILEQQHARQRPPHPLLAVRTPAAWPSPPAPPPATIAASADDVCIAQTPLQNAARKPPIASLSAASATSRTGSEHDGQLTRYKRRTNDPLRTSSPNRLARGLSSLYSGFCSIFGGWRADDRRIKHRRSF